MGEFVQLERRDDGVAVIRLDRPKVNALCVALLDELADIAQALVDDPPGAVVVTGGDRIFAAGADISEFGGPDDAARIAVSFRRAFDTLASIPRMVIASIAGAALGGGCELALACDLRIASTKAVFGQPEILLGIIPGAGGTQRLARLVGPAKAKDLVLSGRNVTAEEALRIGLADEVVAPEELHQHVLGRAAAFARGAVVAQGIAKDAIDRGLSGALADGLTYEAQRFAEVFATEDARIGVASFLEHGPGKATFVGH
jgi:enoyl-CoA hydratase/carnithine racemase